MNATQDLIAAALTAADELDEINTIVHVGGAVAKQLRELCARAMVQPEMAETEAYEVSAAEVPMPEPVEQLAITRYRPVPNGMFGYKVVAGDGTRSVFEGTKSECTLIARKLTEAFLDGAHVAGDARESAGYARGLAEGRERCAVEAWMYYMDTCKRKGIGPDVYPQWCCAAALRGEVKPAESTNQQQGEAK